MTVTRGPVTLCRDCRHPLPPGCVQCVNPRCRTWNFPTTSEIEDDVVRLSDATVSQVERCGTLCATMDYFFGGGIVRTSTILIGGAPGAGKTTLMLQLSDVFIERFHKRDVIYIANEQSAAEIRDVALRLAIKNMHEICIVKAMGGLKSNLYTLVMSYKPCLVIVDSLTKLVGEDMLLAVHVAEQLKALTVELNCPSLIVNQVTKGLDHAGLQKLQHATDTNCMIYTDPEDGSRVLATDKNRNGPAPRAINMAMTEKGLTVLGVLDDSEQRAAKERATSEEDDDEDDDEVED
jgi:DNA repair protein RadA/Sms